MTYQSGLARTDWIRAILITRLIFLRLFVQRTHIFEGTNQSDIIISGRTWEGGYPLRNCRRCWAYS